MSQFSDYNPQWIAARYNEKGEQEWERFSRSPVDAVGLFIHTHYLREFVKPGWRVLDVGAGPGRFTQVLGEMGCRVVAADISQVQLDLHRKYAEELAFDDAVEDRLRLDVCDMSRVESESFDAVVCYGGPLSYAFERAPVALGECVRVCKRGGLVFASVMSLWGGAHRFLQGVLAVPPKSNRKITDTGDLTPRNWEGATHHCHMFRSGELRQMVRRAGLTVLAMSASNCVSTLWDELLTEAKEDPAKWQEVLRMELEACRDQGCLDMGTHMIVVGRKD
jgi:ubiquinone/menaquinone biosynthesis C-methylase UbiE